MALWANFSVISSLFWLPSKKRHKEGIPATTLTAIRPSMLDLNQLFKFASYAGYGVHRVPGRTGVSISL